MVRIAVATVESVFRIPDFARIDVTPAKNAEPNIILRIFQKLKLKKLVNLRFTSSVNSPCGLEPTTLRLTAACSTD